MGLTIVIGVTFFVALMAIVYFGAEQAETERRERAKEEARRARPHTDGRTADEVVFDLEHRIDSDLRDVADALRSGAEAGSGHLRGT